MLLHKNFSPLSVRQRSWWRSLSVPFRTELERCWFIIAALLKCQHPSLMGVFLSSAWLWWHRPPPSPTLSFCSCRSERRSNSVRAVPVDGYQMDRPTSYFLPLEVLALPNKQTKANEKLDGKKKKHPRQLPPLARVFSGRLPVLELLIKINYFPS